MKVIAAIEEAGREPGRRRRFTAPPATPEHSSADEQYCRCERRGLGDFHELDLQRLGNGAGVDERAFERAGDAVVAEDFATGQGGVEIVARSEGHSADPDGLVAAAGEVTFVLSARPVVGRSTPPLFPQPARMSPSSPKVKFRRKSTVWTSLPRYAPVLAS